jgi:hypothetical protein
MAAVKKTHPGRPAKYQPIFAEMARSFILDEAPSDAELGRKFGVSPQCIIRWKLDHEDFRNAYDEAWDHINTGVAEASLVKLATGFEFEEKTFEVNILSDTPKLTKVVRKVVHPDKGAIELLLRNRAAKRWPKGEANGSIGNLNIEIHTEPK